jgi:hypothetical protein
MGDDTNYDRKRPQTTIASWAISILAAGCIGSLAISAGMPSARSSKETCTVIVDRLQRPVILPTNSFLHRAVVVALKSELKFLGRLLHKYAEW